MLTACWATKKSLPERQETTDDPHIVLSVRRTRSRTSIVRLKGVWGFAPNKQTTPLRGGGVVVFACVGTHRHCLPRTSGLPHCYGSSTKVQRISGAIYSRPNFRTFTLPLKSTRTSSIFSRGKMMLISRISE